jgi:hypothetical protein
LILGPDRRKESPRIAIPRQKQMIAIVDHQPERRVVIGPATPAGLAGGLVQHNVARAAREAHRRCEPGKTSADDMDNGLPH